MASDTDLKLYKSATVSDGGTNGGRMSANEIVSGAVSALFAPAGAAELLAGSTKWRKAFAKWADDDDSTLSAVKSFLDKYTAGDDIVTFIAATQINTQSQITGSEKQYGCGKLDANVLAAATEMDVLVEDGADHTFEDGDLIRITDMASVSSLSGNEEYVTIVGTPSVAGDVITIEFTPALVNGYSASASRVMNVYEPGDIVASVEDVVVTAAGSGTFNEDNLLADNIGSVEQDWTATFTNATTFGIVGDTLGSVGSGNVGSGASPNNPNFSKPYFVIQSAGFGGTFQAGDTIEFTTHPSSAAVFFKRRIPASSAAVTPNKFTFATVGETPPE